MSKWTKEEVLSLAGKFQGTAIIVSNTGNPSEDNDFGRVADMLREYAAHLAAQAEWPSDEDAFRVFSNAYYSGGTQSLAPNLERFRRAYAALQSVRPPVGVVSDDRLQKAIGALLWINEEVWPLVHGLTSRETLRKRFRELPSLIEYLASRHAPAKD